MALALSLGGAIALSCVDARPVSISGSQVLESCASRITMKEIAPVQSYALEWRHVLRVRDEINLACAEGKRRFMVLSGIRLVMASAPGSNEEAIKAFVSYKL
jgi:hypothetical protein